MERFCIPSSCECAGHTKKITAGLMDIKASKGQLSLWDGLHGVKGGVLVATW